MDIVGQRCCGLDVHKKSIMACVITSQGQETRAFRTLSADLPALPDRPRERKTPQRWPTWPKAGCGRNGTNWNRSSGALWDSTSATCCPGSLTRQLAQRMDPFEETVQAEDTIPGIGRRTAEVIVAEMGDDHVGWGVSRQHAERRETGAQSCEEQRSLDEACLGGGGQGGGAHQGLSKTQYRRLARRIGANRAAMAVAHNMVAILHHVIRTGQACIDLGHGYFEERDRAAAARHSMRRLERLGFQVTLQAA